MFSNKIKIHKKVLKKFLNKIASLNHSIEMLKILKMTTLLDLKLIQKFGIKVLMLGQIEIFIIIL